MTTMLFQNDTKNGQPSAYMMMILKKNRLNICTVIDMKLKMYSSSLDWKSLSCFADSIYIYLWKVTSKYSLETFEPRGTEKK